MQFLYFTNFTHFQTFLSFFPVRSVQIEEKVVEKASIRQSKAEIFIFGDEIALQKGKKYQNGEKKVKPGPGLEPWTPG